MIEVIDAERGDGDGRSRELLVEEIESWEEEDDSRRWEGGAIWRDPSCSEGVPVVKTEGLMAATSSIDPSKTETEVVLPDGLLTEVRSRTAAKARALPWRSPSTMMTGVAPSKGPPSPTVWRRRSLPSAVAANPERAVQLPSHVPARMRRIIKDGIVRPTEPGRCETLEARRSRTRGSGVESSRRSMAVAVRV